MTNNDMQIPISGLQNEATKKPPIIDNPTKKSNPPNQKTPPKHTEKFGKGDWKVH